MGLTRCVLLGTVLLLVTLLSADNVSAARGRGGGHHSYPSSRGLSGHGSSGSHSYPSRNPSYPSSGGLSGNNGGSHTYPSSGGSHAYPSSGGSHAYPSSGGGLSGNNHGYPANKGVSGNTHTTHTTNVYNYNPPQQIRYTPAHGPPVSYPVYHGPPPTYVYQYKDSGSKYGTLLAGLALLNLGTLAAGTAYVATHSHSGSGSGTGYKAQPGEICKFGVRKENGDYEETRIDCQLITSFIFQAEHEKAQNGGTNTSVVTTTVTNVTMVNTTNGAVEPAPVTPVLGNVTYTMLPNGTLIPNTPINMTSPEPVANGQTSSVSMTTTTTNTTVTNALDVKGSPIDVTPGMKCYVIRNSPTGNMKKTVPCGLLQSYATQSLKKNSATRNLPVFTILAVVSAVALVY